MLVEADVWSLYVELSQKQHCTYKHFCFTINYHVIAWSFHDIAVPCLSTNFSSIDVTPKHHKYNCFNYSLTLRHFWSTSIFSFQQCVVCLYLLLLKRPIFLLYIFTSCTATLYTLASSCHWASWRIISIEKVCSSH